MSSSKNNRLDRVLQRASRDREFRQRLLTAPDEPLVEMLGTLPKQLRVKFIEKPPDLDALIVLPDFCELDELTPSELDVVAGGEGAAWDSDAIDEDEPYDR